MPALLELSHLTRCFHAGFTLPGVAFAAFFADFGVVGRGPSSRVPADSKNRLELGLLPSYPPAMFPVSELIEEVLSLPRTDRSYLAKKLIESLETDEAFTSEEMEIFSRRSREVRDGTVKPLTLEELQRDVRARLA